MLSALQTVTTRLVTQDDRVGNLHQRPKALGREFACKHVRVGAIGFPELPDELPGHLLRLVGVRMSVGGVGPVDPGERELGGSAGVLHVQQRREVVLLRVALVLRRLGEAGRAELAPEAALPDHEHGMAAGEREELGADAEALVGDLREHGALAARRVARRHLRLPRQHLDVAGEPPVARGVDVHGEPRRVPGEEPLPERREGEVRVGEEQERHLGRARRLLPRRRRRKRRGGRGIRRSGMLPLRWLWLRRRRRRWWGGGCGCTGRWTTRGTRGG